MYCPALSDPPTQAEIDARCIWDRDDAWALSVLTARLSDDVQGLLGPVIDQTGQRHMAWTMYDNLHHGCQTAPDLTAALALQEEILNTCINNGDIGKFIMDWSSGLTTLSGYGYNITMGYRS